MHRNARKPRVPVCERFGNGNAKETSPKRFLNVSINVSGFSAVSGHVSVYTCRLQEVSIGFNALFCILNGLEPKRCILYALGLLHRIYTYPTEPQYDHILYGFSLSIISYTAIHYGFSISRNTTRTTRIIKY